MRIYMVTNVYQPKVGGVTRSVDSFAAAYRAAGHEVKVMAPSYPDFTASEPDVLRVPAVHEVLDGSYSLPIPYPGMLATEIERFPPDIVHAHHPFLLGATAHKLAATLGVPIVYTHHVRFDAFGNYFPSENGFMHSFVQHLAVHFANLCDAVVAPGSFVHRTLREAGVTTPIEVIPTGVDCARFAQGDGQRLREELGIPPAARVIGHLGRLAREKNLEFLAHAIAAALAQRPAAHVIVAGDGEMQQAMRDIVELRGVARRVHFVGELEGERLVDCYAAMNIFAFASQSETQGMVITEAMAAGVPVVALAGPGVEDVLVDGENGSCVSQPSESHMAAALVEQLDAPCAELQQRSKAARRTAESLSQSRCAAQCLALYERLQAIDTRDHLRDPTTTWEALGARLRDEFRLLQRISRAARDALVEMNTN